MAVEIEKMLSCGAIERCTSNSGFLSPMFLRKKSDGSNRPIFNLRQLNRYLNPPKFRLINHHKIPSCLNEADFMVKIDLSQAYFHIPIVDHHRRFLAFNFGKTIFQMTCLPFGLATAPYIFAKITNWVANFFRERGIRIVVYLDDFLLLHQNPSILTQQCQFVQTHLLEMGWCINYRKSTLSPSRIVEYLGIIWDTEQNIKRLPKEKIQKCANLIETTLANRHWSWWLAKVLLGNLNFATSIVPLGRLHCRLIQIAANKLPMEQRHKKFQLSEHVIAELQWWIKNIAHSSPIHQKGATIFITTDAAKRGWGATVGNTQLSGLWSKEQMGWHSNRKELVAVFEVLQVGTDKSRQYF